MFPWLPFLSLRDGDPRASKRRRAAARRGSTRKHSSLTSVWLNVECGEGVGEVRVEYLPVPGRVAGADYNTVTASSSTDLGFGSTTATNVSETRADSAPLGDLVPAVATTPGSLATSAIGQPARRRAPIGGRPETPSSRSPRSTSANNSRPGSAAAQLPPVAPQQTAVVQAAPPPRRRGRMFETSAAMLEIFGGAPSSASNQEPPPPKRPEPEQQASLDAAFASTAVYEAATTPRTAVPSASQANVATTTTAQANGPATVSESQRRQQQESQKVGETLASSGERAVDPALRSASVAFQHIAGEPPTANANDRPQYGRKNTLAREGVVRSEWEPMVASSIATTSSFQTVPNHDELYERARHRGNWEGAQASFNQVLQYSQREISPMRRPTDEQTEKCPAEDELKRRHLSGQLRNGSAEPPVRGEEDARAAVARDPSLECPLQGAAENGVGVAAAQNGHTPAAAATRRRPPPQRGEGVAEIFGAMAATTTTQSSGDAQSGGADRRTNVVAAAACGGVARAADAAGDPYASYAAPTTSDYAHASATGSAPPPRSNGSCDGGEARAHFPPSSSPPPQKNHDDERRARAESSSTRETPPRENGVSVAQQPNGNGDHRVAAAEEKRRRFVFARAEDGSGMVAAAATSGNASGDASAPTILIRNAQVVNDDAVFPADVLIAEGQIKQILSGLEAPENAEVIDANGRWLLPAGIDVHCELESAEDLASATKEALSGGTTTIVNVVRPVNDAESLAAAVDRARALVEKTAECNVALSVQLQRWTTDLQKQVEEVCARKGVNSFLLDLRDDAALFEAMEALKKAGALARVLPENRDIIALLEKQFASLAASEAYAKARPAQLEADRIHRLCVLGQLTNSPFTVLSVGSSEASRAVQAGRQQGALVSAEVPICALASDSLASSTPQSRIPVRRGVENARDALELLANGPLSVCVSDHSTVKRSRNLAIGTLAVGERLPVLWEKAVATGRIDLMRFVSVTSTNAAKLLNFYPKKGRIAVGADADLVVWNGQASQRIGSRNANERNAFDGMTVSGSPELTICAGRVAYRAGKLVTPEKRPERFVPLAPNAPHVFSVVQLRERTLNLAKPDTMPARKESNASNGSGGGEQRPGSRDRGTTPSDVPPQPEKQRPITKVIHPPGGRSTGFW